MGFGAVGDGISKVEPKGMNLLPLEKGKAHSGTSLRTKFSGRNLMKSGDEGKDIGKRRGKSIRMGRAATYNAPDDDEVPLKFHSKP